MTTTTSSGTLASGVQSGMSYSVGPLTASATMPVPFTAPAGCTNCVFTVVAGAVTLPANQFSVRWTKMPVTNPPVHGCATTNGTVVQFTPQAGSQYIMVVLVENNVPAGSVIKLTATWQP